MQRGLRRHHNNKGRYMTVAGIVEKQVRQMAKKLKIKYKERIR